MVLGFILYESIDLVYNVGKLSYNAITGTYNWYYGIQSAEIQERELEMTKIHELEAKIDQLTNIIIKQQKIKEKSS
tara:strand:- start:2 stop:229 length:228 start_codon:yes stop_codon:yes gene_type:complete